MSEIEYDFVSFDGGDDDFVLTGGGGEGDGRTAEQVNKDHVTPPIPDGRHTFAVVKVELSRDEDDKSRPFEKARTVYLAEDGAETTSIAAVYRSYGATVTLALVEKGADGVSRVNVKKTLRDFYVLPPSDDSDEEGIYAYLNGTSKPNKDVPKTPFNFDKVKHFLRAIGHPDGENGRLHPYSLEMKNWRTWPEDGAPRFVTALVMTARDENRQVKVGGNGEPLKEVAMWKYQQTEDTVRRLKASAPAEPPPAPMPPVRPTAAAAPSRPAPPAAPSRPAPPAPPASRPAPPAASGRPAPPRRGGGI